MNTPAGDSSGSSLTPDQSSATESGADPDGSGQDAGQGVGPDTERRDAEQQQSEQQDSGQATAALGSFELPGKLRVHALAKLLGTTSREIISALDRLGNPVRSAQSNITRDIALRVVRTVRPEQLEGSAESANSAVSGGPAASADAGVSRDADASGAAGRRTNGRESGQDSGAREAAGLSPVFAAPQATFLAPEPVSAPATERAADDTSAEQTSTVDVETTGETTGTETTSSSEEAGTGEGGDHGRRRRRRGRRGRGRGRGADNESTSEESAENGSTKGNADKSGTGKAGTGKSPEKSGTGKGSAGQSGSGAGGGRSRKDEAAAQSGVTEDGDSSGQQSKNGQSTNSDSDSEVVEASQRRRRRRRRKGSGEDDSGTTRTDDPPNTVVHVRDTPQDNGRQESGEDEVRSVKGSTRLEAKRQRRRDGREAGRRRAPVLSESEFLARRESVDRRMVVRESGEQTQIAVLEDNVLVENFVTSSGSGSLVGNVYLGRVQNVLPSMEAAFVDIGRGRNAVLYAGEVDWDAAGLAGKARRIEQALSTGDSVLVQVTKDPVGHKGARLTTQISLPGRFLVYVPGGGATGISRKLPDNERKRLKDILKRIVPDNAGVIIRTASEGTSEQAIDRDVRRLQAQWDMIKEKAEAPKAQAPQLLYEEPDLLIKVVRDLFTEDFSAMTVQGDSCWDTIEAYVQHVAPDLVSRLDKHVSKNDVFTEQRITEQITKALDRKVWLPSGGYLVVDRTEAMTVIDVNTGKYTGSGGNLEETVTRNNLEAAEEIVRQLRLRDIGGIIVIDFIDMVLESNRDLVLRRLTECLGRDRTRHQVAEVTSLGLVQMTRKRVGTGLLEAYSNTCEHCRGRGLLVSTEPVTHSHHEHGGSGSRRKRDRGKQTSQDTPAASSSPSTSSESGRSKGGDSELAKAESAKTEAGKAEPAKTGAIKPGGNKAGEAKPDPASGHVTSGEDKTGEVKTGAIKPGGPSGESRTGEIKPGDSKTGEPVSENTEVSPPAAATSESGTPGSGGQATVSDAQKASAPMAGTGGSPTGSSGSGAESARPKRRKVSRAAASAGTAPAAVVLDSTNTGTEAKGTASGPVPIAATPPARSRRRAAGRPTGPPPEESEETSSTTGSTEG